MNTSIKSISFADIICYSGQIFKILGLHMGFCYLIAYAQKPPLNAYVDISNEARRDQV